MTKALFATHASDMGGGELFLADLLSIAPGSWHVCLFADGPLAAHLRTRGRAPIVLANAGSLLKIRRELSLAEIASSGLGVFRLSYDLSRILRNFDLICANSQKALFVSAVASLLSGRPLVWVLHDIITDGSFSPVNRRAAVLFANRFASRVVVNSQETARAFVAAGGRPELLALVYNGFDAAAWPQSTPDSRRFVRRLFNFDERPIVGLFGRLAAWKGQHVLLQALARDEGIQALIVGGALYGQDDYADFSCDWPKS